MKGGALACLLVALLFVAPTGMQVSERGERSEDTIVHEAMPAEQAINERRAAAALDGLDGFFTENRGQVDNPEVLFYTQGDALSVGLTRTGAMLTLMAEEDGPAKVGMSVVRLDFAFCNAVVPMGVHPLGFRTSLIVGNDRSLWGSGAESFERVVYEDVYDGVDIVFRFEGDRLKYDVEAEPGACVGKVVFQYRGADGMRIDATTGDLLVRTACGVFKDSAPVASQMVDGRRADVPVRFDILGDLRVGFTFPDWYDTGLPLIIDPGLMRSTMFGGTDYDDAELLDVDDEGYVYLGGRTTSPVFPVTPGAYDVTPARVKYYIVKMSPDLGSLVFCTLIGVPNGWSYDTELPFMPLIKALPNGNILMVHCLFKSDFPVTSDAYCMTHSGVTDLGVLILNADGSDLVYSTLIGGEGWDMVLGAYLDDNGALYLAGETNSVDFPVTSGAYCTTLGGGVDGFVMKMPQPYKAIAWCTFIPGSLDESGWDVAVDATRNVYVTGPTYSPDFPVTAAAYQPPEPPRAQDAYLMKLNPAGSQVLWSTYLGGGLYDECLGIKPSSSGGAHAFFSTQSQDFPVTQDAADGELSGLVDTAIVEVDGDGGLLYSTYLGGAATEWGGGHTFNVDDQMLFLTFFTNSADVPTTKGSYAPGLISYYDTVIVKYDVVSKRIVYSSYIGGATVDLVSWKPPVIENPDGSLTLTGGTNSPDFPTTTGAFCSTFQGGMYDLFVVTIDPSPVDVPGAPTGLGVELGDAQLNVSWDAIDDESYLTTGYHLYYGTSPSDITTVVDLGRKTQYLHEGLTNGVRYYYQVTANNSAGESARSPIVSAVPMALAGPPIDLVGESGNGTVTLTWSPPEDLGGGTLVGYDILRGSTVKDLALISTVGAVSSYVDGTALVGTSYFYAVAARNERGPGKMSDLAFVKCQDAPGAPTSLVATAGESSVMLTWGRPAFDGGATVVGYRVYRGTSPDAMSLMSHRLPTELFLQDLDVTNGVTYHYAVSAFTAVAEGPRTDAVAAMPRGAPTPPQGLVARAGDMQVRLDWMAPASDGGAPITGHIIQYGTLPDALASTLEVGAVATATVTSLTNGQLYYFRVLAVNEVRAGPASSPVSATPYGVPGAPTNLAGVATEGGIALTWKEPLEFGMAEVLTYRILRGTGDAKEPLAEVMELTTYTDASAAKGITYTYTVVALNDASLGLPSNEVTVLMPNLPGAPVGLTAVIGDRQVLLSWSPPASDGGAPVLSYVVLRGLSAGGMAEIARLLTREYNDPDVVYGQTYLYAVQAVNVVGAGAATETLSVTPLPPPGSPGQLEVELKGDDVTLTWVAPGGQGAEVTGYNVMRGPSGDRLVIIAELGDVLTYTDRDLAAGRTYYYSVVARSDAGESDPAPPVSLRVKEAWDPMAVIIVVLIVVVLLLLALQFLGGIRGAKGKEKGGSEDERDSGKGSEES